MEVERPCATDAKFLWVCNEYRVKGWTVRPRPPSCVRWARGSRRRSKAAARLAETQRACWGTTSRPTNASGTALARMLADWSGLRRRVGRLLIATGRGARHRPCFPRASQGAGKRRSAADHRRGVRRVRRAEEASATCAAHPPWPRRTRPRRRPPPTRSPRSATSKAPGPLTLFGAAAPSFERRRLWALLKSSSSWATAPRRGRRAMPRWRSTPTTPPRWRCGRLRSRVLPLPGGKRGRGEGAAKAQAAHGPPPRTSTPTTPHPTLSPV